MQGYHERVTVDPQTEATLNQLFLDYTTRDLTWSPWSIWIYQTMNECHKIPSSARFSLELRLGWSVTRIVLMTATPVVLSLVVGTWYMQSTGDTQTAWTIASYIVTAAGGEYPDNEPSDTRPGYSLLQSSLLCWQ